MARLARALGAAAALAALAAACGTDTTTTGAGPSTTAIVSATSTTRASDGAPGTTPTSDADLPDIDVVELASGGEVALRSLTQPGRPTLLWFWAPHCTVCRREAPDLLAFEATHGDRIDVLGLGAQDTLDEAYGFLDDTDTHDLRMVWDRTGRTWIHHDVTSQPTVIVLDVDGQVAGRWYRDFDVDGILTAAGLA